MNALESFIAWLLAGAAAGLLTALVAAWPLP